MFKKKEKKELTCIELIKKNRSKHHENAIFPLNYLFVFINFLYYTMLDFLKLFKKKEKSTEINESGLYVFTGLPGQGKSFSAIKYANNLKARLGDNLTILANVDYKFRDQVLYSQEQIKKWSPYNKNGVKDKVLLVIWDEMNSDLNSKDYKKELIDSELFGVLTQRRKLNIILLVITQQYYQIPKDFRSMADKIFITRSLPILKSKRLTTCRIMFPMDYEEFEQNKVLKFKMQIPFKRWTYVQDNFTRSLYSSFAFVPHVSADKEIELDDLKVLNIDLYNKKIAEQSKKVTQKWGVF